MRAHRTALAVASVAAAFASTPAFAAPPSDPSQVTACLQAINDPAAPVYDGAVTGLYQLTANDATFRNAKDQTGLLGKLDSATHKLNQAKWVDAYTYLVQYRDKAMTLQATGKLGSDPDLAATATAIITQPGACAWLAP